MTVVSPPGPGPIERQVLDLVGELVVELGGDVTRAAKLDDVLDRDLGISSLERVELLIRIERAFGVRLPDAVMAEAATVGDLVRAILHASPAAPEPPPARILPAPPGAPAPFSASTLVEVLVWHAERTPDRVHIHLRQDAGTEMPITYGAMWTRAAAVAAGLKEHGVRRGDRVALMLRTEQAFFETFFGTLIAGAVPVPLYPPFRRDEILAYARRQQAILRNAGARVLVTFAEVERIVALIRAQVPSVEAVTTAEHLAAARPVTHVDRPDADEAALIQYTSGSTGAPKGVPLSHANILANIRAIGEAIAVGPGDVTVSWLPLYHDMGLIGAWLGSLYFGVPIALMAPTAFLARPARWLWAIHAHHGTVSPAPNFAFDLCARKIDDREIVGLDLSGWRLAFNGSEVVSPETIDRFTRRFVPYGFRPDAMCPVYGLAESAVGLTMPVLGRLPRIDRLAREPFERARAVQPAGPDEARPLQFVSCGRPLPGHQVSITDADGRALGERVEGHIRFRGPSVTPGYFGNPVATAAVLHDGWMDSGDLGYWADGELFITGREKDLIVQAGRHVYPQEVEDLAATVAGVRKGCVAAFGVHDPAVGTERLVVVAETREPEPVRREAIRQAVMERLVTDLGVPPDIIVIADPGTVLKTSSGKIRRGATRDAYLNGSLGRTPSVERQWIRLLGAAVAARLARLAELAGRVLFTAYVALVLVLTLPVLWMVLLVLRPGHPADRAAKGWSRMALAVCGIRVGVTGLDHLVGLRSGILVANHGSYIDPVVLMAAVSPSFRFVAKRQLTDYPVVGTVIRRAGHATIEKASLSGRLAAADDIVGALRRDGLLMIFPEGTFVRAPGLLPFRLGAFRTAVDTGSPVVPIALRGTRDVLPDGTWLFRRGRIEVTIGAPLYPRTSGWEEMVRLRDAARAHIARESGESPAGR